MPIVYKIDVLKSLKEKGHSTYELRKGGTFGEKTIQALRTSAPISFKVLAKLCELLECEVSDIIEYKKN